MIAEAALSSDAPVLFEEREAGNGRRIGIATLNAPRMLNGLSLGMVRLLDRRLHAWEDDESIAVVALRGAGGKAFSAGADLHRLYRSMAEYRDAGHSDIRENTYARNFFSEEYRLDYRIHTYPKPVLCWGHGIVMGGGIGLMAGASHRVVTEQSRLAFPEITIGLYPDVGGSWLLRCVPGRAGLFLALTGAAMNAGDAIHAGLADWHVGQVHCDEVFDALLREDWSDDVADNAQTLANLLREYASRANTGPMQEHGGEIDAMCASGDLGETMDAISGMATADPWLAAARDTLAAGAPGSARLAFELQQQAASLTLADVFRLECTVSLHCAAHGDFAEGIRALLVDKDRKPHWHPSRLAEATSDWAQAFFVSPWPEQEHPLAQLGYEYQGVGEP